MRCVGRLVVLLLLVSAAQVAGAQTFKVKTPKGDIRDLGFALNPQNCDLLVVFELNDKIHATVVKDSNGKRKGKKAKPISGAGEAHRPYGMYRLDVDEYLVAWDTAPADLEALARRPQSRAAGSVVRVQRVRSSNGKTIGAALSRGDASMLNVSPHFFSSGDPELGGAGLIFVENAVGSSRARSAQIGSLREYEDLEKLFRDASLSLDWVFDEAARGLASLSSVKRFTADGELALGVDVLRGDGLTNGLLMGREPGAGELEGPFNTPGSFLGVDTFGVGYTVATDSEFGYSIYTENQRVWGEQHRGGTWMPFAGRPLGNDDPVHTASNPTADNGFGVYQGRVPRTDVAYVAGQQDDGTVRLFRVSDDGPDAGEVLFRTSRTIEQMRLILMPDSNEAILLWIEAKNRKTDQIRGLTFEIE